MSGPIDALITRFNPTTAQEFENALKEIIQELTLAGLARAQFFDKAAFYGGTALRIFHKLPRFSEDLDFTLLSIQPEFSLKRYFKSVEETLNSFGLEVEVEGPGKKHSTNIESAFLKANTKIHFLKIEIGKKFANQIQNNKKINIKFEVDITPPLRFETEVRVLSPPITTPVKVLKPSYLFAGKMHAVLFRKWKNRVKGRDFYDLLWFLGQKIPLNLGYLESKMLEGGMWEKNEQMNRDDLLKLLKIRFKTVDFKTAAQDVAAFIRDQNEVLFWNQELFLASIEEIKIE